MTALRQAVAARASVLIAYVDNHGASTERIIDPLGLEGGWLTALDHRSEEIRTFAVHRITSVSPGRRAGLRKARVACHETRRGERSCSGVS